MPNPYKETNNCAALIEAGDSASVEDFVMPSGVVPWDIPRGLLLILALLCGYGLLSSGAEERTAKATLAAGWAYQSNTCVRTDGSREDLMPPAETVQMERLLNSVETRDGRRVYAYTQSRWDCMLEWRKR